MSAIPGIYPKLFGGPLYWRDEESGKLAAAMDAYLKFRLREGREPSAIQLALLIEYIRYWVAAPVWDMSCGPGGEDGLGDELAALRKSAEELKTVADVAAWLNEALDIGIDPL